jgi:hypothetical protein
MALAAFRAGAGAACSSGTIARRSGMQEDAMKFILAALALAGLHYYVGQTGTPAAANALTLGAAVVMLVIFGLSRTQDI